MSLSDKIIELWYPHIDVKHVKEKVQNAQKRLGNELHKNSEDMKHEGFRIRIHDAVRIVDKIFEEEFGDKLI